MFLTKQNTIKWKKLAIATLLTLLFVLTGIFWFDKPVFLFMRNFDCGMWRFFGHLFSIKVWFIASFAVLLVFYAKKIINSKPQFRNSKSHLSPVVFCRDVILKIRGSYAFYIFVSVFTAGIVAVLLKFIIGRSRPIFYEALGITRFVPFSFNWAFNSMPSGHTVATFAGLVMFGLLAPKYKNFTWGLAVLVGVSRICVGAHWPTDVILGAFIGMVVADLVKAYLKKCNI